MFVDAFAGKRTGNVGTVRKAAMELMEKSDEETTHWEPQLLDLTTKWEKVRAQWGEQGGGRVEGVGGREGGVGGKETGGVGQEQGRWGGWQGGWGGGAE